MKQGEHIAMEDDPNAHAEDVAEQGTSGDHDMPAADVGTQSGRVRGKLRTEDREDVEEGRQSDR